MADLKKCSKCGKKKCNSAFSPHRDQCKECRYAYEKQTSKERRARWKRTHPDYWRAWADRNPERNKLKGLRAHLKRTFGITVEQYRELLKDRCDICGSKKRLHLDHDHTTGRIRGTLCMKCNTSIGQLGDDAGGIKKVLDYLTE